MNATVEYWAPKPPSPVGVNPIVQSLACALISVLGLMWGDVLPVLTGVSAAVVGTALGIRAVVGNRSDVRLLAWSVLPLLLNCGYLALILYIAVDQFR